MSASQDIVAIGGTLDSETLVEAYRRGIFPWPARSMPMLWYCPRRRAILQFDEIHLGRSLARARRQSTLRFTIDGAFSQVIRACAAAPRPGQDGTWIFPKMVAAYERMHAIGFAHSAEAWRGDRLVGGIYGVSVDGTFAGESMFHDEANASKLALLHLCDHLRSRGLEWIDIQMMTPHMERLGAREMTRAAYLRRLKATQARGLDLFPDAPAARSVPELDPEPGDAG